MKIEHFALHVAEPVTMAEWYVKHLGCTIARAGGAPAHGRFLLDDKGAVMFEIYNNPKASVPDYTKIDPLHVHLAFLSANPAADPDRLILTGANGIDEPLNTPTR